MNFIKAELPQLITSIQESTADAEHLFGTLTAVQLNWKPNAEAWSIGQCLDHVMVTNGSYMVEYMTAVQSLPVERIIVTSPASRWVTYSLLDAFRIIAVHEAHHLYQTEHILALPEFP